MSRDVISQKPYLLRGLYEWCTDNGYTPYVVVQVDHTVRVPQQYVKEGQITLNVSPQATIGMMLGNELIEFSARFSGKMFKIEVPVDRVLAIYARENNEGMAFPMAAPAATPAPVPPNPASEIPEPRENAARKGFLQVVK